MKKSFLFIVFLIPYILFAQEISGSRVSIGFNFSPDYNFRTIRNSKNDSDIDFIVKTRNDREIAKIGYTTGVNMAFKISQKFAFETGLHYSNKGYQTKKSEIILEPPTDPDNPPLTSNVQFQYSYQYLGVPLKINLSFGEGDFRFISGIGVTTNFLLNSQHSTIIENPDGKRKRTMRKTTFEDNLIDLSPMICFGIDYKLSSITHLKVEPVFRYGTLKTENSPIKEHLWNAGLNVALSHEL